MPEEKKKTEGGRPRWKRQSLFEAIAVLAVIVIAVFVGLGWGFGQFNSRLTECAQANESILKQCVASKIKLKDACHAHMTEMKAALGTCESELGVAGERCLVKMGSLEQSLAEKNAIIEAQKVKIQELGWEVERLKKGPAETAQ